jgi:uncharacterized damage-inducible protein DinB
MTPKQPDPYEGMWQGYEGEWLHVSRYLTDLAQAVPAEQFGWRPQPGTRSISEVLMHIAMANFYLLSLTGPSLPPDMKSRTMEKDITEKPAVIEWLQRSFEAVKAARAVSVMNHEGTVDGIYLRVIVHANEHLGQLVAYARHIGITPPWSN